MDDPESVSNLDLIDYSEYEPPSIAQMNAVAPWAVPAPRDCVDFSRFYLTGELSDFIIESADQEFKVHKLILWEQSDFFAASCRGPWKESQKSRIQLTEDDPRVVEAMVRFMYQMPLDDVVGKCDFSNLLFYVKLYRLADKYLVPRLKTSTVDSIREMNLELEDFVKRDFSETITEIYKSDHRNERRIKELIVRKVSRLSNMGLQHCQGFQEAVRNNPQFAVDLILGRFVNFNLYSGSEDSW